MKPVSDKLSKELHEPGIEKELELLKCDCTTPNYCCPDCNQTHLHVSEKQLEPLCPLCNKQSLSLFGSKDEWEELELYCANNYCNGKYSILVKSLATELKVK